MSIFEEVFSGERYVVDENGEFRPLGNLRTYYGYPLCESPSNMVSYVDCNGDGAIEALLRCDYILHYDSNDEKVYAHFISPRSGYTYYTNGEFGYDLLRYRITGFDHGNMVTDTI